MRHFISAVAGSMMALGVIALMTACSGAGTEPRVPPQRVKISNPVHLSDMSIRTFSGTIREASEVKLAFLVGGPLSEVRVGEGEFVKKGQLMASIDTRDYELQFAATEAQYLQVKAEFDRLSALKQREGIAANEYEKAVAGEKMMRMQLQRARDQLNDTRMTAPFAGYVQSVHYKSGEQVDAGMPVLSLLDMGYYLIDVDIPVSVYLKKHDFESFWCHLPQFPDTHFPLQLVTYHKRANNQLYRFVFRLDPGLFPSSSPGMRVGVGISFREEEDVRIGVPLSALMHDNGLSYVWKFDRAASKIVRQEVLTGTLEHGMVTIISGLDKTDEIVVAGVHVLQDGQLVEPIEQVSESNVGGLL